MRDLRDIFGDIPGPDETSATSPKSLSSISDVDEEQDYVVRAVKKLEEVELLVDYSDFANFVSFNSALDYFNITGEKILNEYPYDADRGRLQMYLDDLDGYQRHVLKTWPSCAGHLRFNPAHSSSYVTVEDVGLDQGVTRTGILSPNTGSLSVEAWINSAAALTGTEDVMIVAQKLSGSNGFTVYLSGSAIRFKVTSGSMTDEVSASLTAGSSRYVACVMDRSSYTGSIYLMTGSSGEFPVVVSSASVTIFGSIDLADKPLYIGSGSLTGKVTRPLTASLDDVAVWKKPLALSDVTSSFNVKRYSQKGLAALYRFNETGSLTAGGDIAIDYSGHKLNGRIQRYYSGIRGSGSLLIKESLDPVLSLESPEVAALITLQQASGSDYDRANSNKLTDMLPEKFFQIEDEKNTQVLENFLYILARHFDRIKLHIDQLPNLLKVDLSSDFDQTPDALLDVVARFFGWEFTGNFLNADAFQYLLGRDVLQNVRVNEDLDSKLYQIKDQFWRRFLSSLPYVYKTKGTRESVRALLRAYGADKNFVKLKEYGFSPTSRFKTNRIHSQRSIAALGFTSGSVMRGTVLTMTSSISSSLSSSTLFSSSFSRPTGNQLFDLTTPVTYVIPTSSAQFNAIGVPVPTHCWKFDVASGSVFRDLIGGTLPLDTFMGGQLAFEQTASGIWNGTDAVSTRCVEFDGTNAVVAANPTGSALLDVGLTGSAIAVGFLFRSVGRPGPAQRNVFGKRNTGADNTGWNLRTGITSNSLILQVTSSNGATNRTQTQILDRAWHVCIMTIDRMNQVINIVSDNVAGAEASIAAVPTITNTASLTMGRYGTALLGAPDYGFQTAAAWAWTGSAVPQISANGMTYPRAMLGVGKDPTGRLPLSCFTASMTVPVGSSSAGLWYCTYHGNAYSQLPFSHDPGFTHASKMGLGSVRSAINYITSSDEMHVWQASDGATVGARATSPAGMLTAELLGGVGTKTRYFTVGATAGTKVSGYSLVRAQAGTAPGRLIIYNSTAALTASVIAATSFTASTAWDRYEVSAALPAGCTSVSYGIEYTAPIYTWRNTFVSGSPTAVIYSTASLGSMHRTQYSITGSAGTILLTTSGEVTAKIACISDDETIQRSVVDFEDTVGGGSVNRVQMFLTSSTADLPRAETYNSAGTLALWATGSAITASAEHTLTWTYDDGVAFIGNTNGALLVNGTTYYSQSGSYTATDGITKLWIGSDKGGGNQLNGIIANVIVSGALSASVSSSISSSLSSSTVFTTASVPFLTGAFTVETRVLFPLTSSDIVPTALTGTVWRLVDASGTSDLSLLYAKQSIAGFTGSLILSCSSAQVAVLTGVAAFDGEWKNISVVYDTVTGSVSINVKTLDGDRIASTHSTKTTSIAAIATSSYGNFAVGITTASLDAEYWMQEARVWKRSLVEGELTDHALNFQSYGTQDIDSYNDLLLHWRLDEDLSASAGGTISRIYDIAPGASNTTGSGFPASINPYKRFLNDFNFIAPIDLEWNEDKVRVFDATEVDETQFTNDRKMFSVEFNMIDALNEDISQMLSEIDQLDNVVGLPVNTYRWQYDDLQQMRELYFKRLQGRLNFRVFADMLEFFDRAFFDMIKRLIPAKSKFLGDEFVVESHMLERSKVSYERVTVRDTVNDPIGIISVLERFV